MEKWPHRRKGDSKYLSIARGNKINEGGNTTTYSVDRYGKKGSFFWHWKEK